MRLGEVAEQLLALGARGVQVNVTEAAVEPAAGLRQANLQPLIGDTLSVRRDSARRAPGWFLWTIPI